MKGIRPLGAAAVLLIAIGLGTILASLVTNNDLFTGATEVSSTAATASALVFVVAILCFIAVGRPWKAWERTAYW